MAKIQIKSEKLTSFGGIFPIMEKFDRKHMKRLKVALLLPLSSNTQSSGA